MNFFISNLCSAVNAIELINLAGYIKVTLKAKFINKSSRLCSMEIEIRQAKLSDLDILKKFQGKLVDFERPLDPTIKNGDVGYYNLENKLKSSNVLFLIAEAGGKPAGCGFGEIMKSVKWSKHKYKGFIGMMFVEKEFRGKGIGGMIIERIVEWFRKEKINDVRLQVYEKNASAVKAYMKSGFKSHILEMRLELD
jgi:GNAT superfamily N-acetyltransferase